MFRIVDFIRLLRYASVAVTIISVLLYELIQRCWSNELQIIKILAIVPWVSFVVALVLTSDGISRQLWKLFRCVNKSLYPDLNGAWRGEITTQNDQKINAQARIKQTLLQVSIDLHTESSKSITLETTPVVEGGQAKLYYVYRSIPKKPEWASYHGFTIFDFRTKKVGNKDVMELSGSYTTTRKTIGRIRLEQFSDDVHEDVSYY